MDHYYTSQRTTMSICGKNGRLKMTEGPDRNDYAEIKIRPLDAAHSYPGDDFLIEFAVYQEDHGTLHPIKNIVCKDTDFVSVYDKKMVWRANLYMNDNGQDWNNEHPWNVPADDLTTGPSWWNAADWGYNEWNRTYKVDITNTLQWGVGDGTQVIILQDFDWTPVRGQASPYSGHNHYQNAVAYDYDYSDEGFANAWDSPFDFAWKLNEQRLAIWNKFTPSYVNEEQAKWLLQDVKFPNGIDENTIPYEVNPQNNTAIKVTNGELYRWNRTTAPKNIWKYYWKDVSGGHQPYIPGLGLYWHDIHKDNNTNSTYQQNGNLKEKLLENGSPLISFNAKKSAGTDCIGFVERSASYRNTSEARDKKRIYTWQQFPEDRAEKPNDSNFDNDAIKRSEPKEGGGYTTKYGEYPDSKSEVIVSRVIIKNMDDKNLGLDFYSADVTQCDDPSYKGPSDDEFDSLISKFLTIVPGDVIYYGHTHIGEIANVDYDMVKNATTINQLLQSITVIECVFNGEVNYVIKRSMFATGAEDNSVTFATDKQPGCWKFVSTTENLAVKHLRNWEIRRLK